jgi:hypothetical protein
MQDRQILTPRRIRLYVPEADTATLSAQLVGFMFGDKRRKLATATQAPSSTKRPLAAACAGPPGPPQGLKLRGGSGVGDLGAVNT